MPQVLLVEDNAILASTLVRFLRSQDMTVVAVLGSAEAALEAMQHNDIDLALVDVSLPGMNGIDLVARLREEYPEIRCIMVSGHNEASYVGRALAAGAKGYVVKSDPFAIVEAAQSVLGGKIYLSQELRGK